MRISEDAAARALKRGAFLMAGDSHGVIAPGEVIDVTGRFGLRVVSAQQMAVIDAPLPLIGDLCQRSGDGFAPFYSDFVYETAQQAALAQMLNDAGEGFDIDDLIDWESLGAEVSVITIEQAVIHGN